MLKIALRASNSKYVRANGQGSEGYRDIGLLTADRDEPGVDEIFDVMQNQNGEITLRTQGSEGFPGRYWCAEEGGGGEVHANRAAREDETAPEHLRTAPGVWEWFTPSGPLLQDLPVVLRTMNGHMVGHHGATEFVIGATAELAGEYETFWVQVIEGGHPEPSPSHPGPIEAPRGIVHTVGRAMYDDGGVKNFKSTTFFWSVRGARDEEDRWRKNLQFMKDKNLDGYRSIAAVTEWGANSINPYWPDYEDALRKAIDVSFDEYGLRQFPLTVYGGGPLNFYELIDKVIRVCKPRPEKIGYFEVCNEVYTNSKLPEDMLKEGFRRLKAAFPNNLIALSCPKVSDTGWKNMLTMAKELGAGVFPAHTERKENDRNWRQCRQCYDFNNSPISGSDQEGPGPASSVGELWKPRQLGMKRWLGAGAGCGVFVHHTGSGIFGVPDPGKNRQANIYETPGIDDQFAAIEMVEQWMPQGFQNWKIVNNGRDREHPLQLPDAVKDGFWEGNGDVVQGDVNKNYAILGPAGRFYVGIFGLNGDRNEEPYSERRAGEALYSMKLNCFDSLTGILVREKTLHKGQWLTLPGRRDREISYIIEGQRL